MSGGKGKTTVYQFDAFYCNSLSFIGFFLTFCGLDWAINKSKIREGLCILSQEMLF